MLIGHRPSRAARAALERGDAVAVRSEFVQDGVVRFDTRKASQFAMYGEQPTGRPLHTMTVPAVVEHTDEPLQIAVFLTPQGAARHGLETAPNYLVGSFPDGMSTERSDALAATWQASAGQQADSWYPSFTVEAGPQDPFRPIALVVVLLAGIVTLGATTVAIGLARADGRRDDEVLDAIGASPGVRRRVSTWQAAVLTLVGSLVGVALGGPAAPGTHAAVHPPPRSASRTCRSRRTRPRSSCSRSACPCWSPPGCGPSRGVGGGWRCAGRPDGLTADGLHAGREARCQLTPGLPSGVRSPTATR
ncbi:hypothetical protein [Curtobacterium sp. MCPF17_052]|uniref:hypothetical protein n=1 Tax=Curtobacterium sp. MCPF17_052 TaxID=2175655 RepID=UPI0024E018C0|nr:hypothetical protein [Curtobacterium sp. MCPF17_052]WIB11280.1 hypothetical protein DEJ36_09335 [Curtobacterium sp. MCPF17_052]